MPLRIGETFAGYRILRVLGSGGMGEVYLVQHPRLPRHYALKVLRPDLSSDTSFRERFIREADLAAGLRHPHIVGILDRGDYDGQLWIAMDYVDGTDPAELIQQRYPAGMPAELAISAISAVASPLSQRPQVLGDLLGLVGGQVEGIAIESRPVQRPAVLVDQLLWEPVELGLAHPFGCLGLDSGASAAWPSSASSMYCRTWSGHVGP